jgi:8-oxo-dGTP pyrophosphatase MutT (NUDIX family)
MTPDSPPTAASLLLVRDDPFEVLMVSRNSRGAFASVLVFPGGRLDPDDADPGWESLVEDFSSYEVDERARRIAVIRETWEETSIVVGSTKSVAERGSIPGELAFRDFIAQAGLSLRLDSLTSFSHWVTPVAEPRRFDTYFYLASAPEGQLAVADGNEIVGSDWVSPAGAAAAARTGELPIIFPTLMNLDRLAESDSVDAAVAAARLRPHFTVQPVFEEDETGARVIVIPAEAGYSVTRFSPSPQP